ncbi:hypothetical protein ACDH70_18920 [Xanthomonas axonopodis pv. poinsettiicola]|uniref:hypothetical protein n=1 Tax=Xanthomonas TaxID=338 RepID=UPI001E48715D|nr:hypothetical protein [Xanthomonas codiaei]MCC8537551.1 hypothetical protein [Xanthomonas codiaei]
MQGIGCCRSTVRYGVGRYLRRSDGLCRALCAIARRRTGHLSVRILRSWLTVIGRRSRFSAVVPIPCIAIGRFGAGGRRLQLLQPCTRRVLHGCAQRLRRIFAGTEARPDGGTPCGLRQVGLCGCRSKHRGHRCWRFERLRRCVARAVGRRCGVGSASLHCRCDKRGVHRCGRLELHGVLRGCVACAFGLPRGLRKPGIHARRRQIARLGLQQCSQTVVASQKALEGRAHCTASRLRRSLAKA